MKSRGFTLIELLVVIAIIGVLSSVILVSLNTARAKARDAQRLSDMQEVRKALEMYFADNGGYPSTSSGWFGACSGFGSKGTSGAGGWVPNLAPTYMPVLPVDPKPNGGNCYLYRSDGVDYMLLTYTTVETYTGSANKWPRPLDPAEASFAFYSPGGSAW